MTAWPGGEPAEEPDLLAGDCGGVAAGGAGGEGQGQGEEAGQGGRGTC